MHVSSLLAVSCPNGRKNAKWTTRCISCTIYIKSFVERTRKCKKIKRHFLVFCQWVGRFRRKWPTHWQKTRYWNYTVSCPFKKLTFFRRNSYVFYDFCKNLSIPNHTKKGNLLLQSPIQLYDGKEHFIPTLPAQNHS